VVLVIDLLIDAVMNDKLTNLLAGIGTKVQA
jgi:hypothetical protein